MNASGHPLLSELAGITPQGVPTSPLVPALPRGFPLGKICKTRRGLIGPIAERARMGGPVFATGVDIICFASGIHDGLAL